ncbi:hypothetical protein BY996DRAFT_4577015 [Phakopsora pachyrhizi]|uniref:DNA replication complex GINS protein PSF2 n=1 Tax=Phakopsora pachyrhizi TaxID=170000 RepID=A0AAV0ADZ0_PHAPC|nr:hypothetical protein BY996DRAFT_4602739 [Phakopsora pachyrhizi]KAI8458563.1 hypothetical protein BY996DRAFT_4577015 [Phakopsora pachyrhizi]CAH7666282.1 hypothetical protein PPACK8108_LOCUS620 [Phakopsora pachyrhizi]
MALPKFQRLSFEPSEQEFITMLSSTIDFIPNCSINRFRNLDDRFIGPLRPLTRVSLPLWFSVQCKQKNKGKIVCPDWLSLENLRSRFKDEISLPQFSELPFNWLELSKILIETAPDDIPSLETVRKILKDLREVRQSKTRSGLTGLDSLHLETPNLSSLELNELRPIFTLAHIRLLQLDPKQDSYDQFLSQLETSGHNNYSNGSNTDRSNYNASLQQTESLQNPDESTLRNSTTQSQFF